MTFGCESRARIFASSMNIARELLVVGELVADHFERDELLGAVVAMSRPR